MSEPQPSDDPRPRRALILGGALMAAILLWNMDWWGGGDRHGVSISIDGDDVPAEEIGERIEQRIRERIGEAHDAPADEPANADENPETGADEADPAAESDSDLAETVQIQREEGRGVTIRLQPQEDR